MKRTIVAVSLCGLLFLLSSPLLAEEGNVVYNSEIHFFAGGFLGDKLISTTGNPLFTQVNGVFNNDFIGGARLTYFLNPYLGVEGGVGFSPASILTSAYTSGGTYANAVINVDTYVFNANLVGQMAHGPLQPFVTGGVAAVHFRFHTADYGTHSQFDGHSPYNFNEPSETDFAVNLGGGLKVPVRKDVMLRAEARYYWANSDFTREKINFTEVSGGVAIGFNF